MSKKITVVLISIVFGSIIMDSGYGKWQEEFNIEGSIRIIPNPKMLEQMETTLEGLKSEEELRLVEEQQLLAMEKILEEQKELDELLSKSAEKETVQQDEPSIEDNQIEQSREGDIEDNSLENEKAEELETEEPETEEPEIEAPEEITEKIASNDNVNMNVEDIPTSNASIEDRDDSSK